MYGFRVSKPGKSVWSENEKDRVIDSEIPCLKILQLGKRDFTINNGATVTYEESIFTSLPFLPLIYMYEPSESKYKPATSIGIGNLSISYEFTATKLYVTVTNGTGGQITSHYYWFIGYS